MYMIHIKAATVDAVYTCQTEQEAFDLFAMAFDYFRLGRWSIEIVDDNGIHFTPREGRPFHICRGAVEFNRKVYDV